MFRKVLLVLAAIFFVVACGHYERTAQEPFRVEWAACNLVTSQIGGEELVFLPSGY